MPRGGNTDIQSLRVGFFGGGGSITALVNCRKLPSRNGKLRQVAIT